MKMINITGYPITFFKKDGSRLTIDSEGKLIKPSYTSINEESNPEIHGIEIISAQVDPRKLVKKDGTFYVVNELIAVANLHRNDFLFPGSPQHGPTGRMLGFRALYRLKGIK